MARGMARGKRAHVHSSMDHDPERKRKRTKCKQPTMGWAKRSWTGLLRASLLSAILAVVFFVVHRRLQSIYFRTCKANLMAVVLHNRSDVCHGLDIAITAIERGYQDGFNMLMRWGGSAAVILLPCMFSRSTFSRPLNATRDGTLKPSWEHEV